MTDQPSLFPAPAKPPDVTAICEQCGREIILQRHTAAETYSEFMSGDGRCYTCTFRKGNYPLEGCARIDGT